MRLIIGKNADYIRVCHVIKAVLMMQPAKFLRAWMDQIQRIILSKRVDAANLRRNADLRTKPDRCSGSEIKRVNVFWQHADIADAGI